MNPTLSTGRTILLALMALMALMAVVAEAAEPPATLRISQAVPQGKEITAFVDVRTEADVAVTGLTADQVTATVGAHPAQVSRFVPFPETGAGVNYLFLVDLSRSLSPEVFGRIKAALTAWIEALGPEDRAGLIGFGDQVRTLVNPTADKAALTTALQGLAADNGNTALHEALARGIVLARQRGEGLPTRSVIVTLTDGIDDAPGGMSADEVYDELDKGPIPIYAVGYSSVRDRARREAGLDALGAFARRSGGVYLAGQEGEPGAAFSAIRARISEVYALDLGCEACVLDGNRHRLQVTLRRDGLVLGDGIDVRLLPEPSRPAPGDEAPEGGAEPPVADGSAENPAEEDPGEPGAGTPPESSVEPAADDGADSSAAETPPEGDDPAVVGGAVPPPGTGADSRLWIYGIGGGALLAMLATVAFLLLRDKGDKGGATPQPAAEPPAPGPSPAAAAIDPSRTLDGLGEPAPRPSATLKPSGPPPPSAALRLTFMSGQRRGEQVRLQLSPRAVVGRGSGNALGLQDPEASARHAEIEALASGRIVLRDLGSTNGTRLNGIDIRGIHPLSDGDIIGLGQTELRVGL